MRRLRFAIALAALAVAGSTETAVASARCPGIIENKDTGEVCSYTGFGACPNCEYDCNGERVVIGYVCPQDS